jgi:hypothetical protein
MTDTPTTRLAPQIIRVPPPESPRIPRIVHIVAICLLLAGLGAVLFVPYSVNLVMGASFAIFGIFLLTVAWIGAQRTRRRRAEMLAAFPDLLEDPVAARLDGLWQGSESKSPKPKAVCNKLGEADLPACASARIVCFGPMQIPDIGELRFEPYIVSATAFLARRLLSVPIALVLAAFWLFQTTHAIPGSRVNLSGFTYVFVLAAVTTVTWVWRGAIRPTYVRMAPGVIQVLEYGLRRRKPVIRTYRMEAGTLVLVTGGVKALTVTLLREGQKDTLPIAQLRNRAEATERLWQALLSTAPTPHMSEEELID